MLVTLFLTPYIIRELGDSGYGLWRLLLSLTTYMAVLDLGLASALAKYVASYAAENDEEMINQLASTTFFVFSLIALLVVVLIIILSPAIISFFEISVEEAGIARIVLILLALNYALSLLFSVFNAVAVGFQRYDVINVVVGLGALLNVGLTLGVFYGWRSVTTGGGCIRHGNRFIRAQMTADQKKSGTQMAADER